MPPIRLDYRITESDYREALAFHQLHDPLKKTNQRLLLIVFVPVILALIVSNLLRRPPAAAPFAGRAVATEPDLLRDTLQLPIFPWAVLLVATVAFFKIALNRSRKLAWQGQPELHRPHTIEATDSGILVSEPAATHTHTWPSFVRFGESANLFLLYVSQFSFHIIPKSAFATPNDLAAFRNLAKSNIADHVGITPPSAFPVLPPGGR